MCICSKKYWSVCVNLLNWPIICHSWFLTALSWYWSKNDPIAIFVLDCVVISQYKALYPLYFSSNLTTITISWVLVKLRNLNNLFVNFLNNEFCVFSALFPGCHTYAMGCTFLFLLNYLTSPLKISVCKN